MNKSITKRYNKPTYTENPSIVGAVKPRSTKTIMGSDKQGVVIDKSTGEILGHGGAMFYQWQEVDNERFVKVYLEGLKQTVGLTKAGLIILEVVYNQLQEHKDQDTVNLGFSYLTGMCGLEMSQAVHSKGINDLLSHDFIYQTVAAGLFFVNIQYMFNGNRLAFVQGYYRKGTPNPMAQVRQLDLIESLGHAKK